MPHDPTCDVHHCAGYAKRGKLTDVSHHRLCSLTNCATNESSLCRLENSDRVTWLPERMSNRIGKLFLKGEPSVMRHLFRDSSYSPLLGERFLYNDVEQFRGGIYPSLSYNGVLFLEHLMPICYFICLLMHTFLKHRDIIICRYEENNVYGMILNGSTASHLTCHANPRALAVEYSERIA